MTLIEEFKNAQKKEGIPHFRSGYTVRVHQKIKEKDKERIQIFEGIVLARKRGSDIEATFTVRKVSDGVGVERIFPLYSPHIAKIEVVKKAEPRRAKLYYLRTRQKEKMRREEKIKEQIIKKIKKNEGKEAKNKVIEKKAEIKKEEKKEAK